MSDRTIRVEFDRLPGGNLLMATSRDLPGLVVHGYTLNELRGRVPSAVTDILSVSGQEPGSVEMPDELSLISKR